MQELYMSYLKKYDIRLVEDPFAEDDWDACAKFTSSVDVEVNIDLPDNLTDVLCEFYALSA